MTRNLWFDLETYCEKPITGGSHQYAEGAEVMLWAFADGDGDPMVWDLVNDTLNFVDDLSGQWVEEQIPHGGDIPAPLFAMLSDPEYLVWGHNAGQFDFVVLKHALPWFDKMVSMARRRDTMVQAFAHAMPGALDKLGEVLNIDSDKRKLKDGKRLVRLMCMPQNDAFFAKHGTRRVTKETHPADWQKFIEYAGGDIITMREAHKRLPLWNYKKGKQVELCHIDWAINGRGFACDLDLAEGAVRSSEKAKALLAKRANDATDGAVTAATQRDVLIKHILQIYGVELPDMRADTLERRMADEDLPEPVRELLSIRLEASMNSAAKFKRVIKGVSSDGRLRGCTQFRGAGRTGRWAHRMFQPGNMLRPTLSQTVIDCVIDAVKNDDVELIDMITGNVSLALGNAVRGTIIAPPGKKLVVADLSNIEGRVAAWLAGEEWKMQAFRDFDGGIGHDLYILAYAKSFNVPPESVPKKGPERQIGKVEELMFQYGGGVGAWLTGAATYGIDLDKMTEQVYDALPTWAVKEAGDFLLWLYDMAEAKFEKAKKAVDQKYDDVNEWAGKHGEVLAAYETDKVKARHGLAEKTFVACDAIKRLWRNAHPQISSYWKEIEDTVKEAINAPGVTLTCRKVKVRRDGAWLRCGLPSGRALCYPNPKIEKDGSITYTGLNQYTRQWGRVSSYGGKFFENWTQAVACDQLGECFPMVEEWISPEAFIDHVRQFETEDGIVMHVHDEGLCQTPDTPEYTAEKLSALLCSDLGWNEGLPLAAAGFEGPRYKKE